MCGIFGEFIRNDRFNLDNYIRRLNMMKHRGPDGFGFEYGNYLEGTSSIYHNCSDKIIERLETRAANYFLGQRRLSIIDLSDNAFQPMESYDKRYSITFNGEIYNYIELRRELLGQGCRFVTDHSDTEVLLNAYAKWGVRCLERLCGMFACAILDRHARTVFIARDRIGKKPLYYEISNDRFAFSSELTPLMRDAHSQRSIHPEALSYYMVFGYVPHPLSIVQEVRKLPPASYALVDLSKMSLVIDRYWDIDVSEDTIRSEDDFIRQADDYLTESVSLRLRADVPVAAFISGGTDSSIVVKKISEIHKGRFDIFGADFPQPERSERRYIEQVAKRYDQNLNLSNIDMSHIDNARDVIDVFDEPFDGGSSIAVFDLFKEARKRKGYKVVLTGDGGDEVFAGYERYAEFPPKQRIFSALRNLRIPGILLMKMANLGIGNRKTDKLNRFIHGDLISNYIWYTSGIDLSGLLKDGYRVCVKDFMLFSDIKDRIDHKEFSPVKALQYFEINTILPGRMLYKVDRFSMNYGVEARAPFLDHRLVEMAFTIPEKYMIHNDVTKAIPKKILERDFNKQFVYRKKQGFGNPLSYWFEHTPSERLFSLLLDKESVIFRYVDYSVLHGAYPQIRSGYSRQYDRELWRFLVLGHYLENFKDCIAE